MSAEDARSGVHAAPRAAQRVRVGLAAQRVGDDRVGDCDCERCAVRQLGGLLEEASSAVFWVLMSFEGILDDAKGCLGYSRIFFAWMRSPAYETGKTERVTCDSNCP